MNPLSIFAGPYGFLIKWGIIAALASAFAGYFWFKGNEHGTQKLYDYQAAQAKEAVRIANARIQVVTVTETKYVDRIRKVYVAGATIEKEVKVYVTPQDDAGVTVPVGFVRVYNAAWAGATAGPAAESDRGPSGIPLSTVAEADAANATTCIAYKTQRDGLIEFYRKQQAVR